MSENKRYYWLKLQKDFFKRHDIRIIEEMENGKDYIIFYLKLLTESISHEGKLRFSDTIPYDDKMLATITNTNIDIVRSAVKVFQSLHLMELWDDKTVYMTETQKMIGSETKWAEEKRIYRAKQEQLKAPKDNVKTKKDNVRQEIEKELELDKDIDKEKKNIKKENIPKKQKYGEFENVLLTDEEYKKLKKAVNYRNYYIENVSAYIEQTGKKYKSHYATILNWHRRDVSEGKVPKEERKLPENFKGLIV